MENVYENQELKSELPQVKTRFGLLFHFASVAVSVSSSSLLCAHSTGMTTPTNVSAENLQKPTQAELPSGLPLHSTKQTKGREGETRNIIRFFDVSSDSLSTSINLGYFYSQVKANKNINSFLQPRTFQAIYDFTWEETEAIEMEIRKILQNDKKI